MSIFMFESNSFFSTSPCVFTEMDNTITQLQHEDEILNLQYKLVLKDIIINHLNKMNKHYEFTSRVHQSLINGSPM